MTEREKDKDYYNSKNQKYLVFDIDDLYDSMTDEAYTEFQKVCEEYNNFRKNKGLPIESYRVRRDLDVDDCENKAISYVKSIGINHDSVKILKNAFVAGYNEGNNSGIWHDLSLNINDLPSCDSLVVISLNIDDEYEEFVLGSYNKNLDIFECDDFDINEDRDFKWKYIN